MRGATTVGGAASETKRLVVEFIITIILSIVSIRVIILIIMSINMSLVIIIIIIIRPCHCRAPTSATGGGS